MALVDIIRSGVAIASKTFESNKVNITHEPWIGQDGDGTDQYDTPVVRRAVADLTRKPRYTSSGTLALSVAMLTFLDPIADNGAPTRHEPIDTRDRLTLPDGTTGPIINIAGPLDSGTSRPFLNEVTLGEPNQK